MDSAKTNLVVTKELKEKLSEYLPITPDATFRYIPAIFRDKKSNIPEKDRPVFILKVLDGEEAADIENAGDFHVAYDGNMRSLHGKSGERRLKALKIGIRGWENWKDANGTKIEFDEDIKLKLIPPALQMDLFKALEDGKALSMDETRSLGS
jgi:hypothetical protein